MIFSIFDDKIYNIMKRKIASGECNLLTVSHFQYCMLIRMHVVRKESMTPQTLNEETN